MGQVLVDAGHSELDLVTDALLWTFCCVCCRDAEEQQAEQPDPEGVRTELGVHLRGKITAFTLHSHCCMWWQFMETSTLVNIFYEALTTSDVAVKK